MSSVGFEPVEDANARVLILGTLPGAKSLQARQYYANKANSFWWIMEQLLGSLPDDYEGRLKCLKVAGIALWDVCHSAGRSGSLDSKILAKTIRPNDFESFARSHPQLKLICFTSATAKKIFRDQELDRLPGISSIRCELLPSTSSANTWMTRQQKLSRWRESLGKHVRLAHSEDAAAGH